MANPYWTIRGTYAERKEALASMSREWLEAAILDSEYNDFIRGRDCAALSEEAARRGV